MVYAMKIVQIRGANGSGKTTMARELINLSDQVEILCWPGDRKPKPFATIMHDIKWAVIGTYPQESKMGGCDCMESMDAIKQAIEYIVSNYPDYYGVAFEGMMISKSLWTFPTFMKEMNAKYGTEGCMVFLQTTLDGCVNRLKARGSKKALANELNLDMLLDKCEVTISYANRIEQAGGVKVFRINVETTPKNRMLDRFLMLIDKDLSNQL